MSKDRKQDEEINILNVDELDVEELERRLEMATVTLPDLALYCGADCGNNCIANCGANCQANCPSNCVGNCSTLCAADICGTDCGSNSNCLALPCEDIPS